MSLLASYATQRTYILSSLLWVTWRMMDLQAGRQANKQTNKQTNRINMHTHTHMQFLCTQAICPYVYRRLNMFIIIIIHYYSNRLLVFFHFAPSHSRWFLYNNIIIFIYSYLYMDIHRVEIYNFTYRLIAACRARSPETCTTFFVHTTYNTLYWFFFCHDYECYALFSSPIDSLERLQVRNREKPRAQSACEHSSLTWMIIVIIKIMINIL